MYKTVLIPIDLSHAEVGKAMIDVAKRIGGEGVQIIDQTEGKLIAANNEPAVSKIPASITTRPSNK